MDDLMRTIYYTVREIAKATHRSEDTVRRWIADGRLKAVRVVGGYLIEQKAFRAFLKQCTVNQDRAVLGISASQDDAAACRISRHHAVDVSR